MTLHIGSVFFSFAIVAVELTWVHMGYNRIAYAPGSRQNDDGVMDVLLPGTSTQHMVREIYWKRVMYVYIIAHVAHAGIYVRRMCVFA